MTPPNPHQEITPMAEESKLLPCPFCGGEAELREGEECAYVQCLNASYHRGPFVDGDNNAANEAIDAWNTRALQAPASHPADDVVERVARAICVVAWSAEGEGWDDASEMQRKAFRNEARAALAAIPTQSDSEEAVREENKRLREALRQVACTAHLALSEDAAPGRPEFPDTQRLRSLVNGGEQSSLGKTPMVPVHIDTLRKIEAFLSWIEREWQSHMSHEDFRVEAAIRARALAKQEGAEASTYEDLRNSRDAWRALELSHHATISAFEKLLERALCLMAEAQSCLDPDRDHGDKIAADLGNLQEEIGAALSEQEGR